MLDGFCVSLVGTSPSFVLLYKILRLYGAAVGSFPWRGFGHFICSFPRTLTCPSHAPYIQMLIFRCRWSLLRISVLVGNQRAEQEYFLHLVLLFRLAMPQPISNWSTRIQIRNITITYPEKLFVYVPDGFGDADALFLFSEEYTRSLVKGNWA